jgi:FKBP-type peptidyl-prolyl cis-trans isomerase 2
MGGTGGGMMELDLRVINDNQITGTGQVRSSGKEKGYRPYVVGSVAGDKVTLDVRNPSSGNNLKLELLRADDTLKGERKGEEVVYKKLQ